MADHLKGEAPDDVQLDVLYARPGFLIRRAHQISVWLFLQEMGGLATTTTQYGAMVILRLRKGLDQIGLAKLLGTDRSTTALVVGKLEKAGYAVREADAQDKRRNVLRLTEAGIDALDAMAEPAERARQALLSALTEAEARRFLSLLENFVTAFNSDTRAPIITPDRADADGQPDRAA